MLLPVSAIISQLFEAIMRAKYILNIPELSWSQRVRDKKTKLNICHNMLTSSTQLQNRSFFVGKKKIKLARAKRARLLFFKYANFWRSCGRRACFSSLIYKATTVWMFNEQNLLLVHALHSLCVRFSFWLTFLPSPACVFFYFVFLFFLRPVHVRISFGLIFSVLFTHFFYF